ncbi:MAG TPA: hypothetical protein VHB45_14330 [Alloacidobacterium sp.]|nr:hypothetical protein [Alloacidobacterium sp.]
MASLDELEGDFVEGVAVLILIVFAVIVLLAYVNLKDLNLSWISSGFNNFAGNISDGLYDAWWVPSSISSSINTALSSVSQWLTEIFWHPDSSGDVVISPGDETIVVGGI